MKSPGLHLLPIILLILKQGHSASQQPSHSNEEFRPSRLIFEGGENKSPGSRPVVNSFNVTIAYPPGERGELEDTEISGTFSHPVSDKAEGRTLFGGWAGVGNTFCQNHHEYNPGCCSLGYSNCCGGSNSGHKKPTYHSSGWGGFYQNPPHHHHQVHHHNHNQHRFPVFHKAPPTPIHRPVLPVVPIRPLPRPVVFPARPIVPHHPHPPHHHFQGPSGWGPGVEKPGSCKSSFSFLSKLNFLSKAKDIFGKGDSHGASKGWGWEPPSHNGGWHFYRRSDSFPQTPFLTKRQVGEGQSSHGILRSLSNVFVIGGGGRGEKESSDNAILQRAKSSFYGPYANRFSSAEDTAKAGSSWGPSGGSQPFQFQGRSHHASSQYYVTPRTVGIGSLSGRVLGGGWGWNNQQHQHQHHCRIDYDCPGNDKCCEGICSAPSFFG